MMCVISNLVLLPVRLDLADPLCCSVSQVKDVWQRIMGEPLVLTEKPKIAEDEEN
jgi:hypothetical protein